MDLIDPDLLGDSALSLTSDPSPVAAFVSTPASLTHGAGIHPSSGPGPNSSPPTHGAGTGEYDYLREHLAAYTEGEEWPRAEAPSMTGPSGSSGAVDSATPAEREGSTAPGAGRPTSVPKDKAKGKGKQKEKEQEDVVKAKRTRQSQSCDACRARKVKCDQTPPPEGVTSPSTKCTHCRQLDMDCTFAYKPKKRGPPNQYLKRLEAEREAAAAIREESALPTFQQSQPSASPSTAPPADASPAPSVFYRPSGYSPHFDFTIPPTPISAQTPSQQGTQRHSSSHPDPYLVPDGGTLSRQNAFGHSALSEQGAGPALPPGPGGPLNKHINSLWDESLARAVGVHPFKSQSRTPGAPTPFKHPGDSIYARTSSVGAPSTEYGPSSEGLTPSSSTFRPGASSHSPHTPFAPPLPPSAVPGNGIMTPAMARRTSSFSQGRAHAVIDDPPRPNNPFDAILPRWTLLHVVELYFDYIYPLIPAIHRPTYTHDLETHREERQGEEEWTHMTLALVACTLVQLPRAFVPLKRSEVKRLTERCYHAARAFTLYDGRDLTVQRLTMNYFLSFTASSLGHPTTATYLTGGQAALLIRGRWNLEAMYTNLNPLERELRRRLYWLAYDGDRSFAAIEGNTTMFTEDECGSVGLPLEVDDEYITDQGVGEQPEGKVSLLTGFNCISRLYRMCGVVMDRRRKDKRDTPRGVELQLRLNEVDELYSQVMGLMDDCPEPLRLDRDDARPVGNFPDGWDAVASAEIRSLFLDPKVNKTAMKDAYLVQQGNIYVTQQMVRYMVLHYRDELVALQQAELNRVSSTLGKTSGADARPGASRRKSMHRRDWGRVMINEDEKEQVATDLLVILQTIPIQVIAVNTISLVSKVRFVASTLLDALSAPPPSSELTPEQSRVAAKTQRAQTYLWDFLRILSEIEALYSMDGEEGQDGSSAGAGQGV